MFLNKNYILANELVQHMGIHIANISMLRHNLEDEGDYTTIKKMNNCTFVNTKSHKLPNNIRVGCSSYTFTDVTDKLPCTWVKSEFNVTERELLKSGICTGKATIAGKEFFVFNPDFVHQMKYKVPYILDEKETKECLQKNQIDGSIKLSSNKYFTWY